MTRQKSIAVPFLKRFSLYLAIFLIAIPVISLFLNSPVDKNSQSKEIVIDQGQTLDQITTFIQKEGIVRSSYFLKASLIFTGAAKKVQAGYFYLSPASTSLDIAKNLTKASQKQISVTIPEGLRREEIAFLIEKNLPADSDGFSATEFIDKTEDLEGQLFPDTYSFNKDVTTDQTIDILHNHFLKNISNLKITEDNLEKVVILASLIEREAAGDDERSIIASVLQNRLDAGWPLQIDATVQYALVGNCLNSDCVYWKRSLTREDLAINSPFNTYKYPGLPKGPISNPGLESLKAATNPSKTDYWFYIHDTKGQVHFSKTSEEHSQNVCIYLKKDC
jgi:UPF0755 protein